MGWDILPNRGFILERLYPHQEHERSGLSQLGGAPLFPIHYPWPRYTQDLISPKSESPERHAGQPFHFVAQIDLECLTHDESTANLPRKGMLYFFADLTMSCFMNETASCRVLHYRGPRSELRLTHAPAETPIIIGKQGLSFKAEGLAVRFQDTFSELPYWPLKLTAQETLPREDPWEAGSERDLSEEEEAFIASLEAAFPLPPKPTAADFPHDTFPYNVRLAQIFLENLKEELAFRISDSKQLKELVEGFISPPEEEKKKAYIQKKTQTLLITCDIDTLIEELNHQLYLSPLKERELSLFNKICDDVRERAFNGQKSLDSAKLFACTQGLYYLYALDRKEMLKTCAPAFEVLSHFHRPYPAQNQDYPLNCYHHQFFGHPCMAQDTNLHKKEKRPPQHLLQIDSDDALLRYPDATLYFWLDQEDLKAHEFPRSSIDFMGT